jgi:FixJ family two-component response regulator
VSTFATETDRPLVIIVDDDEPLCQSIEQLLQSVNIDAICFPSTRELLEADLPARPGCIILDVRMPGLSGLDFQRHLLSTGTTKPIIFLTAYSDVPMSVQAMKAGAIDFLTKPCRDQDLLAAVAAGIERDMAQQASAEIVRRHADRYATLTHRERQVLREVVNGRLSKQIAFDLGITEATVKLHRGNVMSKMQVLSVGELVRAWDVLAARTRETVEDF